MRTDALKKAQAKYAKTTTKSVTLKLHTTTDADIIAFLDTLENRQGTLKAIIRKYLKGE